jgi:phospholipase C
VGSSPVQGAEFSARVLDALTANSEVWSRTVLFLCFDENDGHLDHVPPPAPPSYNADGTVAGGATLDLRGEYFSDPEHKYLKPDDTISGTVRPWGLGPRVPMYVISPWSKGGWVCSQVFDHTSVGQFLEKRFGIVIPAISPWHRTVCGDLTAAFDFAMPNDPMIPSLPSTSGSLALLLSQIQLPSPEPPPDGRLPVQEPGVRRSRALPYELHVDHRLGANSLSLTFRNTGRAGAVFHLYDRHHLDRIPRRYTLEAGTKIYQDWNLRNETDAYDLWVYGPNGFVREFKGTFTGSSLEIRARYENHAPMLHLRIRNHGASLQRLMMTANAYLNLEPKSIVVRPGTWANQNWPAIGGWYDVTIASEDRRTLIARFAGRIETGRDGVSDPAV